MILPRNLATSRDFNGVIKDLVITGEVSNKGGILLLLEVMHTLDVAVPRTGQFEKHF